MASSTVNVSASEMMSRVVVTVNLTGVRTWRARLWLGTQVIRVAALVMGCGIRIDLDRDRA